MPLVFLSDVFSRCNALHRDDHSKATDEEKKTYCAGDNEIRALSRRGKGTCGLFVDVESSSIFVTGAILSVVVRWGRHVRTQEHEVNNSAGPLPINDAPSFAMRIVGTPPPAPPHKPMVCGTLHQSDLRLYLIVLPILYNAY